MPSKSRRRSIRRLLVVPGIAFASLVFMAVPSWASGSFTWTATISSGLNSRTWTTDASGSIKITSKMSCDPNTGVYYIQLIRNRTAMPDVYYTKVTYGCGQSESYTWTGMPKATYHFQMTKATDGVTITGGGSVSYA